MSQQSQGKTLLISGRIVWKSGDLFKGQPQTDFNTKLPKLDSTGKQKVQYGFGLAVAKTDPELQGLMQVMQSEAMQIYPNGHIPPSFAFKYKDGDGIDDKGIPFNKRDGYMNHMVFALTTNLPIKFFKYENGNNVQVNEGIKCGDYVRVQVNIKAHGAIGQGKPGMYLNPMAVQLIGYGAEIVSTGVDADSIFGNVAPAVPQGASSIPVAPTGAFPMQQQPAMQTPQGFPQQQMQPAQPHFGVLPQVHQPQAYQQNPQGFPQQQQTMPAPQQPVQQQPAQPQQGFGFPFNQQ